jgi:ABC-2 type transport system permease protein
MKADAINAWMYAGFAMQTAFSEVGLIFLTIFSSLLIAEENSSGTLRMVLVSPLRRSEFFLAKVLAGLLYMAALTGAAMALTLVLGHLRFRGGAVSDSAGVIYGRGEVLRNLSAAFFLSWLPASAAVCYGVLISTLARKSSQAVGAAVGTLFLIETIKHVLGISPYVFTTHLGTPWAIFGEMAQGVGYEWFPEAWQVILVPSISGAVFLGLAAWVFLRRDFNG